MPSASPDGGLAQALEQARRWLEHGQTEAADRLYRQIVESFPGAARAWHDWGRLAALLGHHTAAIPLFRRAVELEAGNAAYRFALAQSQLLDGCLDEAERGLRAVVRLAPDNPAGHNELGTVLRRSGRNEEAIDCFRRAVRLDPDFVAARFNLGLALYDAGRYEAAEASYRKALATTPDDAEIHAALGAALHAQGRFDEAVRHLEEGIRLAPDRAAGYHNLGEVLREQGRLDEAVARYRQGLALAPDDTALWHSLAMTRRFDDPDDPEITGMQDLYEREGLGARRRREIAFALAKACDDCGAFERAWPAYVTANRLARAACDYSIERDERLIDGIIETFETRFFEQREDWGLVDRRLTPVFIVGMPRSGTSLVEQILASHSAVHGCGEIQDLRLAVRSVVDADDDAGYLAAVRDLDKAGLRRIARDYLKRIRRYARGEAVLTNKLPFNFLHIGLIHVLFPSARIIHCRRHPVATCLSIFQHDFTNMGGFAYDLTELGRYYRLYERLMAHWDSTLPGRIETIDYEALVDDPAGWSRRLVDLCGLDWEEACLDFHNARRQVSTASFMQVRRPIYRRAVAHWRHYEAWLGPLFDALGRRPDGDTGGRG